jgi:methionyl-tRNA synthetase
LILPEFRKREVLKFIETGLEDFSVSRSIERARGWGIPVPGDPQQVMYVWYDALGNYITALDYANEGEQYQQYWTDNPNRVHVIGKGITRFHAIYWPAMLFSAGVPLPTSILIHGYITINGRKLSKSLGNVVDPVELAEDFGADTLRYYLLRQVQTAQDGDFTYERLLQAHDGDLADQLGNLLHRVAGMVEKYYDGEVPAADESFAGQGDHAALRQLGRDTPERVAESVNAFELHRALNAIWELVGAANKYVDASQPWTLARRRANEEEAAAELATILYYLVETLRLCAVLLQPFLPETSHALAEQLNVSLDGSWDGQVRWGGAVPGQVLRPGKILFEKKREAAA